MLSDLNMVHKFDDYKKLWPEALQCMVHVHNRTSTRISHKDVRYKAPREILIGNKPDYSHIRIFGSKVKVDKPKKYRKSKMDPKVWDGLHVSYSPPLTCCVYTPDFKRVFASKHATFIENLYR